MATETSPQRRIPKLADHTKLIAESAYSELQKTMRAPGIINYGSDNMAQHAMCVVTTPRFSREPALITISGKPGVGKSNRTTYVANYLGLGMDTKFVSWEGAEQEAIDTKKVIVDETLPPTNDSLPIINRDKPWPSKALAIAERLLETQLHEHLINHDEPIVAEIPARGIKSKGKWIGRSLGSKVLNKLLWRKGAFNHTFSYFPAALVAGVSLEEFSERYREEKKAADTFVKGIRVQSLYGQPLPKSPEEWDAIRQEGASREQMRQIEKDDEKMLEAIEKRGHIKPLPPEEFDQLFKQYTEDEVIKYGFDVEKARKRFAKSIKDAQHYMDIFCHSSRPLIAFIGYNNPTILDLLKGNEKKAQELSNRWVSGTKMTPMKRNQWHTVR